MKHQKRFKCIIFDFDNVLMDTEITFVSVLMDMASIYGVEMDADQALRLFQGKTVKDILLVLKVLCKLRSIETLENLLKSRLDEELKTWMTAVEGMEELLNGLKLPFCVTSNRMKGEIIKDLKLIRLAQFFTAETIVSYFEFAEQNPDFTSFIPAAKAMGFEPNECAVVVGRYCSLHAAIAEGFTVFVRANSFKNKELVNNGVSVFNDTCELTKLINKVEKSNQIT